MLHVNKLSGIISLTGWFRLLIKMFVFAVILMLSVVWRKDAVLAVLQE